MGPPLKSSTNDDDGDGDDSGYVSDEGIYHENSGNNSVSDNVIRVNSTLTIDGDDEYDDGGYGIGGDNGYASSNEGDQEYDGDSNYSGDGGSSFRGDDYESA